MGNYYGDMATKADTLAGEDESDKLDQRFEAAVHEASLKPLLPIIQGLLRYVPSERMSTSEALDLIRIMQQRMWQTRPPGVIDEPALGEGWQEAILSPVTTIDTQQDLDTSPE